MNYSVSLDQCAEVLAGGIHPKDVVWTKLFAAMCQGEFDSSMVLLNRFHERGEPFSGTKFIDACRNAGDVPPTGTVDRDQGELPVAEMVAFHLPHYSRDVRNVIGRIRIDMQAARAWWGNQPQVGAPDHQFELAKETIRELYPPDGTPPHDLRVTRLTEQVNAELKRRGRGEISYGTIRKARQALLSR
jgi:hypothetical protein